MPQHDNDTAASPFIAFLLRGWRFTLLATLLGSLVVTAGVILTEGPLWVLAADWALTLGYAALVLCCALPHGQTTRRQASVTGRAALH